MTGPRLIATAKLAAEFGVVSTTLIHWAQKHPSLAIFHHGRGMWHMVSARAEIRRLCPPMPKLRKQKHRRVWRGPQS